MEDAKTADAPEVSIVRDLNDDIGALYSDDDGGGQEDGSTSESERSQTEDAVEEATQEPEASDAKEPPNESKNFHSRFRSLSRKERALRAREKELQELQEKVTKYEASQGLIQEKPLEFLERSGLDFNALAEKVADGSMSPKDTESFAMQQRIEKLEKALEERDKNATARAGEEKARVAREKYINIVRDVVTSDDAYAIVAETDAIDEVAALVEGYYDRHGEILDTNKAVQMVADELKERHKGLFGNPKVRKLYGIDDPKDIPIKTLGSSVHQAPDRATEPPKSRGEIWGDWDGVF